ncbi:YraN family protein [Paracoccus sulfuroxidans]|uniref:UPF0102 protein IQ24_00688 n=1 Tax=Paracoccus sulfuroxidans TaxID=384678 RepID=A0A562NXE9_9RHOB|nr:putative endonuclease [Paracoccus sulfuroxidans]
MQAMAVLERVSGGRRAAVPDRMRQQRGMVAFRSGMAAEAGVARHYEDRGYRILAQRWRGRAGEIDLVVQDGSTIVFVEVKKAAWHALAAERIDRRKMDRLCQAAEEYCGRLPTGQLTEMRFDAALLDQIGIIEVIENAFGLN